MILDETATLFTVALYYKEEDCNDLKVTYFSLENIHKTTRKNA